MALDWKVISQRNWIKALQATYSRFSQPQGIITRLSNLLYDSRGGFRTCDGSQIFTELEGATDTDGPITEIVLYSPAGQSPYYVGTMKSQSSQVSPPTLSPLTFVTVGGNIATITYAGTPATTATVTFAAPHGLTANSPGQAQLIIAGNSESTFNGTFLLNQIAITGADTITIPYSGGSSTLTGNGGTMTTGLASSIAGGATFEYVVTASDGQGGETIASAVISGHGTPGQNGIQISWTAVSGAVGYNVYGRSGSPLNEINQNGNLISGLVTGTSYVDLGGNPFSSTPPTTNTTQSVVAYRMDAPTFSQVLGTFPSYFNPPLGNIPGASAPVVAVEGAATPQGGVPGATQPLPQIVQFANKLIFALGNGYAPQEYLDPGAGGSGAIIAVSNTYNAQYTDWQASVNWNQGDIIKDSVSGGLFKASQAGVSGTTRPTFNNTLNALTPETSPGTVVWQCIATSANGTPLRGAAHAIVYAGSLWIANTWPTTTSDQLDGPNCIKMSDVNNPESWNPANVAFLAKDDGDQITSLATYTIAQAGISPTGSLVIFKNFSTFQITGVFGAADLAIQQAQTDMGNVAGRTTQFIPGFGIARLAHLGFAYFNGVNDKLISEEIRPYLFGGEDDISPIDWNYAYLSRGAQAANPPMYVAACPIVEPGLDGVTVAGAGPGNITIFVRVEKLVNGIPTAVTPEQQIDCGPTAAFVITTPATVTGVTYRAFAGFSPGGENLFIEQPSFTAQVVELSTMTPGFMSFGNGGLTRIFAYDLVQKEWAIVDLPFPISALKQIRSPGTIPITVAGGANDGAVRRLFAGDIDWDTGGQVLWSFRTGEIFQQGGSAKMFYRKLVIRGSNALMSLLTVAVNFSGVDKVLASGRGLQVPLKKGGTQWQMTVDIMRDAENANAQISGSGPAKIDIESIDWYVKPKAPGAPTSIQKG